jgi:hypothetical protein
VWPNSSAISSAVSASMMSLMRNISPCWIMNFTTSATRSFIRPARSCSVMVSGSVTSTETFSRSPPPPPRRSRSRSRARRTDASERWRSASSPRADVMVSLPRRRESPPRRTTGRGFVTRTLIAVVTAGLATLSAASAVVQQGGSPGAGWKSDFAREGFEARSARVLLGGFGCLAGFFLGLAAGFGLFAFFLFLELALLFGPEALLSGLVLLDFFSRAFCWALRSASAFCCAISSATVIPR